MFEAATFLVVSIILLLFAIFVVLIRILKVNKDKELVLAMRELTSAVKEASKPQEPAQPQKPTISEEDAKLVQEIISICEGKGLLVPRINILIKNDAPPEEKYVLHYEGIDRLGAASLQEMKQAVTEEGIIDMIAAEA
jgi:hypothetical protein